MSKTVKQIFEENCDRVTINRRLVQQIRELRVGFVNRNEDHLAFFSGNLLGVHPIRFRTVDRQRWFDEILEVDEVDLKEDLKNVDYIDPDWVRVNDVMNLSCIWLLYRIQNSSLSRRDKEDGLKDTLLMFQYKLLSSIMAHYFPYPADQATAVATYEALSRKFEIKQHGSWQALLEHRCEMILDRDSIHYDTYQDMDGRKSDVPYMVNDIQQRLREIVKKYTAIFVKVKEENLRITSTSTVIELDGETDIVERTRDHTDYTKYLKDLIHDKLTFIRQELVDVISDAMHTMNPEHLYQVLDYCSDNFGRRGDRNIEPLVDETLLHAYHYISENRGVMASPSDLAGLIGKLKNLYSASRMSDPQLIKMRDLAEKIVKRSVRSRNSAAQASVRTGLQLYIVLRSFARNYYTN